MCQTMDLINAIDESLNTIQRLAELGPALDDGGAVYFHKAIANLALIARESAHLEKLRSQLARCVLPGPQCVVEGQP